MGSCHEPDLLRQLDYSVLQQCMHCGMCLPTCPTYVETQRERNSPRGRIAWMRSIADGELPLSAEFGEEMYYCLGCLACQTACPAGVNYARLFELARADVERSKVLDAPFRRFVRNSMLRTVFTRPWLLRLVGRGLWAYQQLGLRWMVRHLGLLWLLPQRLRKLEPNAPVIERRFSFARIRERERPAAPRYRVAMLVGCVQDLAYASVNRATVDVLLANGCEVVTPRDQGCCGSLHAHNGELETAKTLARRHLDRIDPNEFDAIISNAGGCGSHLRHFAELLAGDTAYQAKAQAWDAKLRDVHEWLTTIGCRAPACDALPTRVTYDESCHLRHGQRVVEQPRRLLRLIPGLELIELVEADWCCGSAGVYSITQPEQAEKLLERKLQHVLATKATVVATGNPGCLLQLVNGLRQRGVTMRVAHPMELLAEAYAREAT